MSAPSSSSDPPSGPAPPAVDVAEDPASAPSDAAATVPPAEDAGAPVESAPLSGTHTPAGNDEPMIDPELASLPAPANPHRPTPPNNGALASGTEELDPPLTMSITESIAAAPAPRPTDFMPNLDDQEAGIDLDALQVDEDAPGSPTAKVMRAIAPPNAAQLDQKWPAPPPNASVNLFIGRALLSNGNDNWPLKPNDIVNWIRKHYPSEWDGDEGRCSAHRVRTYLARKGADMYYEKLNQGCIAGWRIRQNHLWRFENGGFQGRGMKQEEAIAQAQKESEAIATAAHKAAAAEALAQGHPGVKTSMSQPGVSDGAPPLKRQRIRNTGQARRRNLPKKEEGLEADDTDTSFYGHHDAQYATLDQHAAQVGNEAGPSETTASGIPIDPSLATLAHTNGAEDQHHDATVAAVTEGANGEAATGDAGATDGTAGAASTDAAGGVDMNMVHQAMQAAAAAGASGQMDELEMGMQLPIEMQMHGGEHEEGERGYYGQEAQYGQGNYGTGYYGQGGYGYQEQGQ